MRYRWGYQYGMCVIDTVISHIAMGYVVTLAGGAPLSHHTAPLH